MTTSAVLGASQIVHSLVGRVRIHLPAWDTGAEGWVAHQLRSLPGINKVEANQLTRNVLVQFDPSITDQEAILNHLANMGAPPADAQHQVWEIPPVQLERRGESNRVRIPVPGLDRNPEIARKLEQRLETLPGVRAHASPLTVRSYVGTERVQQDGSADPPRRHFVVSTIERLQRPYSGGPKARHRILRAGPQGTASRPRR